MKKGDIDKRIIEWVSYLIDNKEYKSEAEYLRKLGFPLTKLSDAKKGKAGFRANDIGIILMNEKNLNSHWVMTGEGEMLRCDIRSTDPSYINHLKEEIRDLKKTNNELLRENGVLEGRILEIKKANALKEVDAKCAAASGSDLEK